MLPSIEQAPATANATGRPESALAETLNGAYPYVRSGSGAKVIVWSAGTTVSVAAVVVADPTLLVKTARYCLPVSVACAVKL